MAEDRAWGVVSVALAAIGGLAFRAALAKPRGVRVLEPRHDSA